MMNHILAKIRGIVFWKIDKWSGASVKSAYDEISKINKLDIHSELLAKYHEEKISNILQHAIQTTNFYKKNINQPELKEFPIITKELMNKDYESFISSKYRNKKIYKMTTSGSTGTPFVIKQDKQKKRRVNAEIIYFSEKVGYQTGERLIFLRATNSRKFFNILKRFLQNNIVINISSLSEKNISKIIHKIKMNSRTNTTLLGYPSTYKQIAKYLINENISKSKKNNVTGLISGGEYLEDNVREKLEKVFNAEIVSRYSNQENGVIGQDKPGYNNFFIINNANYYVEIFDLEKDILVSDGTIGRIIITDLFNRAMPMIRYDTGDIGAIENINYKGQVRRTITRFQGRKNDMVTDTQGSLISAHRISIIIGQFNEINQFQFIQLDSKKYRLKIEGDISRQKVKKMEKLLKDILGKNAEISIKKVSNIPILSSGKRKYIINMYNK